MGCGGSSAAAVADAEGNDLAVGDRVERAGGDIYTNKSARLGTVLRLSNTRGKTGHGDDYAGVVHVEFDGSPLQAPMYRKTNEYYLYQFIVKLSPDHPGIETHFPDGCVTMKQMKRVRSKCGDIDPSKTWFEQVDLARKFHMLDTSTPTTVETLCEKVGDIQKIWAKELEEGDQARSAQVAQMRADKEAAEEEAKEFEKTIKAKAAESEAIRAATIKAEAEQAEQGNTTVVQQIVQNVQNIVQNTTVQQTTTIVQPVVMVQGVRARDTNPGRARS